MNNRIGCFCLTAICIALWPATPAAAQAPRSLDKVAIVAKTLEGTILSVSPDSIRLQTATEIWTADLTRTYLPAGDFEPRQIGIPPARISFDWDARPDVLKPGMLVRFQAELKRGRARSRLEEVHVLNRVPRPKLGLTEVHDLTAEADEGQRYEVVGRIREISRGFLIVEYPDPKRPERAVRLQARLSPTTVVKLENIMFAKPDQQVQIKGEVIQGEGERRMFATDVRVFTAEKSAGTTAGGLAATRRSTGGPTPPAAAGSRPAPPVEERAAPPAGKTRPEGKVVYRGKILKIN